MEKEQDFIFGREKVQAVRTHRKRKSSFSDQATYFFEAWSSHTQIQQTCTVSQKQLIFRGFKCDIWIPRAKNSACTNF